MKRVVTFLATTVGVLMLIGCVIVALTILRHRGPEFAVVELGRLGEGDREFVFDKPNGRFAGILIEAPSSAISPQQEGIRISIRSTETGDPLVLQEQIGNLQRSNWIPENNVVIQPSERAMIDLLNGERIQLECRLTGQQSGNPRIWVVYVDDRLFRWN